MEQVLSDLQQRLSNLIRRGVIQAIQPGKIPKCRVALGDIVTTWLPVCQGFSGANRTDSNPFAVGDPVTVISEAGDLNNGRVFPGWNTGAMPVPEGSESEHITRYSDGTEIRYDRAAHALKIIIATGGSYEIVGNGTLRGPVEITEGLTVQGVSQLNSNVNVTGDLAATGKISDGKSTLDRVREIFNSHTHPETGSTTEKTNQPM
ncbi:phage baseplate assembly protein V [Serratia plymuthica]|uniref:phage baseplate assembly protein V n=1 Tax=Serratia plymuthica TaxID=82996 RepID=UPI000935B2DC|nr:phage baseplate assembly protein V [Serratia plymuthica]OJT41519.1 baseplate assembly protein [Serratia plymuthica]